MIEKKSHKLSINRIISIDIYENNIKDCKKNNLRICPII